MQQGILVIAADAALTGHVRNCHRIEILGTFEGQADVGMLVVHPGGRCFGQMRAEEADVQGNLEGEVRVRNLIRIRSNGSVTGNVRYGSLALEPGAELEAEMRNMPPTLAGDLEIEVPRGQAVRITLHDLTAHDPDDKAENLTFAVTRLTGGSIVLNGDPPLATMAFSQANLSAGQVMFVHDGSGGRSAGFDVTVTDARGASSGAPRSVMVAVV